MGNSNLLPKWNLSVKNVACRTLWKEAALLLLLALAEINPAAAQQAIDCNQILSGNIAAAGQQVPYSFSGQANERKTLTSAAMTARATVFSPTAAMLISFTANSQQPLTLPESGTYVIQVHASDLVSTGSYSLELKCVYLLNLPLIMK